MAVGQGEDQPPTKRGIGKTRKHPRSSGETGEKAGGVGHMVLVLWGDLGIKKGTARGRPVGVSITFQDTNKIERVRTGEKGKLFNKESNLAICQTTRDIWGKKEDMKEGFGSLKKNTTRMEKVKRILQDGGGKLLEGINWEKRIGRKMFSHRKGGLGWGKGEKKEGVPA